jgi:23S rRNA-/tRNA-specific pseudouridylate synthase
MYLHAQKLRFRHPRTGEWMEFEADMDAGRGGKA